MERIAVEANRPEEGQKCLGGSHPEDTTCRRIQVNSEGIYQNRRGGTGRDSYRRPPEDRRSEGSHLRNFPEGKRGASATSKAPGVKRKVESMRDKGAKRTANRKLHIDDGCMGGGGSELTYNKTIESTDFPSYINNFKSGRNHIFHYCILVDYYKYKGDTISGHANNPYNGHFIVAAGDVSTTKKVASTFMHELGHTIGLHKGDPSKHHDGYSPLIDSDSKSYKSVMSYHYQLHPNRWPSSWGGGPDYSNGPTSSTDHDDWGTLVLDEKL